MDVPLNTAKVTDLTPLEGLTSLETLDLRGAGVTEEQIAALRAALPKLDIWTR